MRPVPTALGVLALSAAVLLGTLAWHADGVEERFRRGDARYPAIAAPQDPWAASRSALVGVPDGVLGIGDDLALRRALRLVRASRVQDDPSVDAWTLARLHSEAEEALLRLLETEREPSRRALVANALGVLFHEDSLVSDANAVAFSGRALEAFRTAVRADPSVPAAKENLELLLSLRRRDRARGGGRVGSGESVRNAAALPPGEGY